MKNGSQQKTKAPVMMASVFAAFRSRFESATSFGFRLIGMGYGMVCWYELRQSAVGRSASIPLGHACFSGEVFVDETVVKAVVVSDMVGRGRPITATTAAAMPPLPPAAP